MVRLFRVMERIVDSDSTVLIQGENGTGKELVARSVASRQSPARAAVRDGRLRHADARAGREASCSAIAAARSTGAATIAPGCSRRRTAAPVFLDQVEDLPLSLQPQLLRAVQARARCAASARPAIARCNWRLIAASRIDLAERVRAGGLSRRSLLPAARRATGRAAATRAPHSDIMVLAQHFLDVCAYAAQGRGPSDSRPAAMELMLAHRWPGNVRELQHAVERAVLLAPGERVQPTTWGSSAA
jgi:DNA-binding NtrC family response regulator